MSEIDLDIEEYLRNNLDICVERDDDHDGNWVKVSLWLNNKQISSDVTRLG